MTQVPLDLLRLILWPRIWSSLVNVLHALRTSMCSVLLLLGGGFDKHQIQLVEGGVRFFCILAGFLCARSVRH